MRTPIVIASALGLGLGACTGSDGMNPPPDPPPVTPVDPAQALSGGDTGTVFDSGRDAYSHPLSALDTDEERAFFRGRAVFRDGWVEAPSSTTTRDGLGPLFNARSCIACHVRDGRGRPPIGDEPLLSMLFRLSIPGANALGGPEREPTYGGQLQPFGVFPLVGDGDVEIVYEEVAGSYGDGSAYTLLRPRYSFRDLAYGPMAEDALSSPRVAPSVYGLGLLEAVPESAILDLADDDDADGDGVSGRPNYVWDVEAEAEALGRFGWKANQPSLLQQTAGAFNGDIGITSRLFPVDDCSTVQLDCVEAQSGGDPELIEAFLEDVTFYTRTLAVPARRDIDDAEVRAGQKLFSDMGCAACHAPALRTGASEVAALANQDIRPYTDLLLHDMGPELADGRPDFLATGSEWQTPPLWGVGLLATVNDHSRLLHDGRARDLAEAILWHGGEGESARERFRTASAEERAQIIAFLESL